MKILLKESDEFTNFKSGKYLIGGEWITPVAYNLDEGWVVIKDNALDYAKNVGLDSVNELMSEYGYDVDTPVYVYTGYDIQLSANDDGEGESAVIGIKWEDGTYAYYGVGSDADHTTFDRMVKAIVVMV